MRKQIGSISGPYIATRYTLLVTSRLRRNALPFVVVGEIEPSAAPDIVVFDAPVPRALFVRVEVRCEVSGTMLGFFAFPFPPLFA